MKLRYRYLLLSIVLLQHVCGMAAPQFVSFTEGDFCLNKSFPVLVYLDADDQKGVSRAAHDLTTDIHKVCGNFIRERRSTY